MARIRSVEHRQYRRARERALTRLANAYPNQYKEYLEEERASELNKDIRVGRASHNTSSLDIRTYSSDTRGEALYQGSNAGDNGGEA